MEVASRDESKHQLDEPGLGREPWSDQRLRAGSTWQSQMSHDVTWELTWNCESNIGREPKEAIVVPLEVHGRLKNAKTAKKYFPMSEWGVPYTVGKLKKRTFQQAKEHAN